MIAENRKRGTSAWRIPPKSPTGIEGYADHVSAVGGAQITLYVSTDARKFHVEAYRLGYYGGYGARSIWRSQEVRGVRQAAPRTEPVTNMVEARWRQLREPPTVRLPSVTGSSNHHSSTRAHR